MGLPFFSDGLFGVRKAGSAYLRGMHEKHGEVYKQRLFFGKVGGDGLSSYTMAPGPGAVHGMRRDC
jgi:hypothetical protein